jgi:hypothetical protein
MLDQKWRELEMYDFSTDLNPENLSNYEFTRNLLLQLNEEQWGYILSIFTQAEYRKAISYPEGLYEFVENLKEHILYEIIGWFHDYIDVPNWYDIDDELILKAWKYMIKPQFKRLENVLNSSPDGSTGAAQKRWRKAVFERDGYKCQNCGSQKTLHAHHIKPRKDYPELAFDIKNGITLCKKCHIIEHPDNNLLKSSRVLDK